MKRPGVEVRARTGYFAPSINEMDTARKGGRRERWRRLSLEGAVEDRRRAARRGRGGSVGRRGPGPDGKPRVTVSWTPREGDARGRGVGARERGGRAVFFDGPLTGGQPHRVRRRARHAAPPPAHRSTPTARRPTGPNPRSRCRTSRARRCTIASPIVFRGRTPIELRAIQADAAIPCRSPAASSSAPIAIMVRFGVVGPAAADATVTANAAQPPRRQARHDAAEDGTASRLRDRPADRIDRPRRVRLRDRRLARRRSGEDAALVQSQLHAGLKPCATAVRSAGLQACYCNAKFTVVVIMTARGWPSTSGGSNCHCLHGLERRLVEQRDRSQDARSRPRFRPRRARLPRSPRPARVPPGRSAGRPVSRHSSFFGALICPPMTHRHQLVDDRLYSSRHELHDGPPGCGGSLSRHRDLAQELRRSSASASPARPDPASSACSRSRMFFQISASR